MSADNQQERPPRSKTINPWYITGFVEGEGTFHIASYCDPHMSVRVKIIPEFHVSQSYLRLEALREIRSYFGCGYLKRNHPGSRRDTTWVYVVRDRNDLLNRIIPFFERYPLRSRKQESFLQFARIVRLMVSGQHRRPSGVRTILNIAYAMNGGGRYRMKAKDRLFDALASSETIRQTFGSQN